MDTAIAIKPIETHYKGYRFRSRLEARWAVFFDALGMKWEYEKEGYALPGGEWYLPDFWLEGLDSWIEIKGIYPTDEETQKAGALCAGTQKRVFILIGTPEQPELVTSSDMSAHAFFPGTGIDLPDQYGYSWDCQYYFCECPFCGYIGIEFNGRSDRLPCKKIRGCAKSPHGDKGYNSNTPRLVKAYAAAKSARFEFGESGA